jgi:hypothetical protein
MTHYTPLHNLLPVKQYHHNRRHYIFYYPSILLFLPLDVLVLTPSSHQGKTADIFIPKKV